MSGDLKSLLRDKLTSEEIAIVYKSYDVVGDIAVIRIPEPILGHRETIAEALMLQHKHVKAVWRQSSPVSGGFRLRELEWLRGEKDTETVHKEHGCLFKVDITHVPAILSCSPCFLLSQAIIIKPINIVIIDTQ